MFIKKKSFKLCWLVSFIKLPANQILPPNITGPSNRPSLETGSNKILFY